MSDSNEFEAGDIKGNTLSIIGSITLSSAPDSTADIIEHLQECVGQTQSLDIYQIAAFRYNVNVNPRWPYYKSALKALLVGITQPLAMWVVLNDGLIQRVLVFWNQHQLCSDKGHKGLDVVIMSNLLNFVIIAFSLQHFSTFTHSGMYRINAFDLRNKPAFISATWLTFGRYMNITILQMVMWGALFFIWTTKDPMAIVLKSSAMFFVSKLDDMFVQSKDFQDLGSLLKSYQHQQDYKINRCWKVINFMLFYGFSIICFCGFVMAVVWNLLVDFCPF